MKNTLPAIIACIVTSLSFSYTAPAQNIVTNTFSNFDALRKGNAIQLSWTALTETNIKFHEVQKSINGSSFIAIATLPAQNNIVPFRYTFLDATPVAGINYYRLRTVGNDGSETFSNILEADNGIGRTEIRVIANPVNRGVLNLQIKNIDQGRYALSLYSNAGQKVFARSFDLSGGSLNQTINLPQSLGRGLYFLQLSNGEQRINKQVLLQ